MSLYKIMTWKSSYRSAAVATKIAINLQLGHMLVFRHLSRIVQSKINTEMRIYVLKLSGVH